MADETEPTIDTITVRELLLILSAVEDKDRMILIDVGDPPPRYLWSRPHPRNIHGVHGIDHENFPEVLIEL